MWGGLNDSLLGNQPSRPYPWAILIQCRIIGSYEAVLCASSAIYACLGASSGEEFCTLTRLTALRRARLTLRPKGIRLAVNIFENT